MKTLPLLLIILLVAAGLTMAAPVTAKAGKFTVELVSNPSPPTVGENLLVLAIKDGDKPLAGADVDVHIDMTTMPMPADAKATPGREDGQYGATVNFSMAGPWKVDVAVAQMTGMKMDGDGTAHFLVETGKGIIVQGGGVAIPWATLLIVLLVGASLFTGVFYTRILARPRGYLVGTLTLAIVLAGTVGVVRKYRDAKTSTVIASATMDMSAQAAPGTVAVATETATAAPFRASVTYTGTVLPDQEEEVFPRVTGRLLQMPFYPGDRIARGQMVARLDATELAAKEAQAAYGTLGAGQEVASAQADIAAARAGELKSRRAVDQARALLSQVQAAARGADGAVKAAQSDVNTARQMAKEADSALVAALSSIDQAGEAVIQAHGDVESAQADVDYWTTEIAREKRLFEQGAIAREELDRETAQATAAQAKLKQAKAAVRTAEAGVTRAKGEYAQAQARQGAAQAAIAAADARLLQAQAERDGAQGRISEAQAAIATAEADVTAAAAGVTGAAAKARTASTRALQARAMLTEAGTVRGYTTIRAAVGGVVTARNVAPGVLVQPGMSILKIAKIDAVRIQVNVSPADLAQLAIGHPLTAHAVDDPGRTITAHITAIFPARDVTARTATVEARVANPGYRLQPGQYLAVQLALGGSSEAITVPTAALTVRDGQSSLFLAVDDGMRTVAKRVTVTTGRIGNDRTEIVTGITAGDAVIVSGLANLRDGDAVTVLAPPEPNTGKPTADATKWYNCPMHVDMESTKPGTCPKCGMDYVPFEKK
jgi:RND family efflux transporter MFP subunit